MDSKSSLKESLLESFSWFDAITLPPLTGYNEPTQNDHEGLHTQLCPPAPSSHTSLASHNILLPQHSLDILPSGDLTFTFVSPRCQCDDHTPASVCHRDLPDGWNERVSANLFRSLCTTGPSTYSFATPGPYPADVETTISMPMLYDHHEPSPGDNAIPEYDGNDLVSVEITDCNGYADSTTRHPAPLSSDSPSFLSSHWNNGESEGSSEPLGSAMPRGTFPSYTLPYTSNPVALLSSSPDGMMRFMTINPMEIGITSLSVGWDTNHLPRRAAALRAEAKMVQLRNEWDIEDGGDKHKAPTKRRSGNLESQKLSTESIHATGRRVHPHLPRSTNRKRSSYKMTPYPSVSKGSGVRTFGSGKSRSVGDGESLAGDEDGADTSGDYCGESFKNNGEPCSSVRKSSGRPKRKGGRVQCPGIDLVPPCKKTFTKPTDASRHWKYCPKRPECQRTKPKCPACKRGLARPDSVKRHMASQHP